MKTRGPFYSYTKDFVNAWNRMNGSVSVSRISEWFGNKKAIMRYGFPTEIFSDEKTAVVVVGVSGIGKSTYVQEFASKHSDFSIISYDDAAYQSNDEKSLGAPEKEGRTVEIMEEQIQNLKGKNIIVDSVCTNPANRAALLRFLSDLGYEIHLVYFSMKYAECNIDKLFKRRAVEQVLFIQYLHSEKVGQNLMRDLIPIRNDIIRICANKKCTTTESLISETEETAEYQRQVVTLRRCYEEEVNGNKIRWQEKRGLFSLGADYFYQI